MNLTKFISMDDKMNDYDYDNDIFEYGDSDEDTEDASETESMKYQNEDYADGPVDNFDPKNCEIKEQIYQDKLAQLKNQLSQLDNGTHPEYVHGLEVLEKEYKDKLFAAQCNYLIEKRLIEHQSKTEQRNIMKEFWERNNEIKENLMADLDEKKKLDPDQTNFCELGDTTEPKTLPTRKLRRRPNDPTPIPDRRRRTSPAQISFLLQDNDISDDLKKINKVLCSKPTGNRTNTTHKNVQESESLSDARIEYGKLFFDKKWFHRGQNINLESMDGSINPTIILHIGSNEIVVRKPNDSGGKKDIKVSLNDLLMKKYSIQRR